MATCVLLSSELTRRTQLGKYLAFIVARASSELGSGPVWVTFRCTDLAESSFEICEVLVHEAGMRCFKRGDKTF